MFLVRNSLLSSKDIKKGGSMLKKLVISLSLVVFANMAVCPLSFAKEIPAGSLLNLKSLNNASSEASYAGDKVSFELTDNILNPDGTVLLKTGSKINGSITSVEAKSRLSMSGRIGIQLSSINSDGKNIPISYIVNKKGMDKFDPDNDKFIVYVVASVLVWPVGLYFLVSKGKETVIPANSIIQVKLDRPIAI